MSIFKKIYNFAKKPVKIIYEIAEPFLPIKVKAVERAADKVVKLFKPKGANIMNPVEKILREMADLQKAFADGIQVTDIGEIMDVILSAEPAYKAFSQATVDEKATMVKEALDNVWGNEPGALIGPSSTLFKFDIPMVDDEKLSDLLLEGVEAYVKSKYKDEPTE